jgi:hypothetical protein
MASMTDPAQSHKAGTRGLIPSSLTMRSITPSSATTDSTCRAKRQQARLQGPQAIDFIHLQGARLDRRRVRLRVAENQHRAAKLCKAQKSASFGRDNREIA